MEEQQLGMKEGRKRGKQSENTHLILIIFKEEKGGEENAPSLQLLQPERNSTPRYNSSAVQTTPASQRRKTQRLTQTTSKASIPRPYTESDDSTKQDWKTKTTVTLESAPDKNIL